MPQRNDNHGTVLSMHSNKDDTLDDARGRKDGGEGFDEEAMLTMVWDGWPAMSGMKQTRERSHRVQRSSPNGHEGDANRAINME